MIVVVFVLGSTVLLVSCCDIPPSSTVENIAVYAWDLLVNHPLMPKGLLYEVTLHETDNQFVKYRGETQLC